jgi:hypothetical protein
LPRSGNVPDGITPRIFRSKDCVLLKPIVLIVTTSRWFPTARLAVAFANYGCTVHALCPASHPITKITPVEQVFQYRGLAPLKSVATAIAATNPDLLISGDDLATWHLHALHKQHAIAGKSGTNICTLVERSLGAPESFALIDDRASFMQASQQAGVRVPQNTLVSNSTELTRWSASAGFPLVLKANYSSGGEGVRVVHNTDEAQKAFSVLHAPPLMARALKRALVDRDTTLLGPSLLRRRSAVNAQSFIDGTEATSAVACWNGEILASVHFAVLQKTRSAGHATVLRRIDNAEMTATAACIVRRLQLSGLHGFDFMVERETGHAFLIEINPRATQVCHLGLGPGSDLPSALVAAITNTTIVPSPPVTQKDVIALFPQEWLRDPASPYLRSGYHDVPWDQPELLRACVRKPSTPRWRKAVQRFHS